MFSDKEVLGDTKMTKGTQNLVQRKAISSSKKKGVVNISLEALKKMAVAISKIFNHQE